MNVKVCNKCGKIGLDQLDFQILTDNRYGRCYYCTICKQCVNNNTTIWMENHPYKKREYSKTYKEIHRNELCTCNKTYQINHKSTINAKTARHRIRKKNNTITLTIDQELIRKKYYTTCEEMNKKLGRNKYEVDHIIPVCKGGSDNPDNLRIITVSDNRRKSHRNDYRLLDGVDIRL